MRRLVFLLTVKFSSKGHITRYKLYHYAYKTKATATSIEKCTALRQTDIKNACKAHRQSFYKLVQPIHRYFIIRT